MSAIGAISTATHPGFGPSAAPATREVSEPRHLDEAKGPRVVAARRTETSPDQIRRALTVALEEQNGEAPQGLVDVLVAHVAHETAGGRRMYNYNFGGIKGRSPDGATAVYKTHERVGGARVALRDGFRAYRTIDDGARDYLSLLERRYPEALKAAAEGGPRAYAQALAEGRYYTDSPTRYARALERHHEQLGGQVRWDAPAPPAIDPAELVPRHDVLGTPGFRGVGEVSALPTLGVLKAISDATSEAWRAGAPATHEQAAVQNLTSTLKGPGAEPFRGATGMNPAPSGRREPT